MVQQNLNQLDASRLPPQNTEAEQAVLGGLLLDKDAIAKVVDILAPEDFYRPDHEAMYAACCELFEKSQPIDLVTLTNLLEKKKKLKDLGGAAYLSNLVANTPSAANIIYHANIIQSKAVLRRLISAANNISTRAYDEERDAIELLDEAEKSLFDVANQRLGDQFVPVKSILSESFERIDELHRNRGKIRGVPTGFNKMDDLLAGLQKSDLIIVAARPSMGKTALVLNIAAHAAIKEKVPVGIFSLEMSKEQLVDRLLTMEAMIDSWRLRTGHLEEDDFTKLNYAMGELSEAPLFIDDSPLLSAIEIKAKARRLQAEHGLGLIVVDYLQLMESTRRSGGEINRVQEVSDISRSLKALARELSVPVIAVSQLSRAVETRPGIKIPQLSDLRESGCLAGDTQIYLPEEGAYKSIESLNNWKKFKVLSYDNRTCKLRTSEVCKVFCTGTKPVHGLTTQTGKRIKATGNHQFLTISGWRRLDTIKPGDHIALPRKTTSPTKSQMDKNELALLGHLIGDGCVLQRHAVQYTTNSKQLAALVAQLAKKVFDKKVNPRVQKERNWYQVYLTASEKLARGKSNPIANWFRELGIFDLRSYEKYIPEKVFASKTEDIAIFLRHLWATDGSIQLHHGKKHYAGVYFASSSRKLAEGVQALLLRLGIVARMSRHSQGEKGRDQYHVAVSGAEDLHIFLQKIGTVGGYRRTQCDELEQYLKLHPANTNRDIIPKSVWQTIVKTTMGEKGITTRQLQSRLGQAYCGSTLYKANLSRERALKVAKIIQSNELVQLAQSDLYWDKVKNIELLGREKVYDLTVEETHNFIANDIIVHNSLEQDADVVMFIYRDEYYDPDTEKKGIAQILVRKHRNGPTGEIDLYFHPEYSRFANMQRQEKNEEAT